MYRFESNGILSEQTALLLMKASEKSDPQLKKRNTTLHVLMILFGILIIAYTVSSVMIPFIVSLCSGGASAQVDPMILAFEIGVMAVGLAIGVATIVYAIFFNRISAKRQIRQLEQNEWQKILLMEEKIVLLKPKTEIVQRYEAITSIVCANGHCFLFFADNVLILETEHMTEGNPKILPGFLKEKTGLPILSL